MNLLIGIFIPVIMILGVISAVLGPIFLPLGQITAWPVWLMTEIIIKLCQAVSRLPFAQIELQFPLTALITIYFIYVLGYFAVRRKLLYKSAQFEPA